MSNTTDAVKPQAPAPAAAPTVSRGAVFGIVSIGVMLANLDLTVVNVAIPAIAADFPGSTLPELSWILNAYSIIFAALLVPAGRLADRASHKSGFLIGLAIFTVASVLCALAPNVAILVGARVLQAVGAAAMVPTSLALLLTTYPPEKRAGAVRAWAAVGGLAAAIGPVIGGLLANGSWPWVFLINVPLGVVGLVLGIRSLPTIRIPQSSALPDMFGSLLLTLSIALLALGVVRAGDWGWGSVKTLGSIVGALALGGWFIARSAKHPAPVVDLKLLKIRSFSTATAAAFLYSVGFAAMLLSCVLWLQNAWGWSNLEIGLGIFPGPFMVPVMAAVAGPLAKKLGAGPLSALGSLLLAGGVAWWAFTATTEDNYWVSILPGVLIAGVGVGLALPTLISSATASLPPAWSATGSGVVTMIRQVGYVLGVAILIAVIGTPKNAEGVLDAFQSGWAFTSGVSAVAAVAAILLGLLAKQGKAEAAK